jgi:cytochrome c oxidase subunit 2
VASVDVLHAFNLPHFRSKVDAVPGQINRMWIQGKELGEWDHRLRPALRNEPLQDEGLITVLSKEDYARWAAEASKNGERLYSEADTTAHWGWDWKGK